MASLERATWNNTSVVDVFSGNLSLVTDKYSLPNILTTDFLIMNVLAVCTLVIAKCQA